MKRGAISNTEIAETLDHVADLLELEDESGFRVRSYRNAAQAHRLGKTHDWVVIYYERAGEQQQSTVVTAERGKPAGKRVVRGREREGREYYGL